MTSERIKALNSAGEGLRKLRQPYDPVFQEVNTYFTTRASRFGSGDSAAFKGRINSRIINPRGRLALRTLQSGMQTGITSPARPWFRLVAEDSRLMEVAAVKNHLYEAEKEMRQMLQRSGLYNMLHVGWRHLGLFGHDCAIIEDDDDLGLYGQQLVPGEFWLGENSYGLIDTVYREYRMTTQQMVDKFVYRGNPAAEPDWSVVNKRVREAFERGQLGQTFPVRQLLAPRYNRDPRSALPKDKPIMSVYWEPDAQDRLLLDSGYDRSPLVASRWDNEGTDVYGNSPAMDTLSIVKRLQVKERELAEAQHRMNKPPINAPAEWRNLAFSFDPEAVNFVSDPGLGARPVFQIDPPIAEMRAEIREIEQDIDDGMYSSLFMMIANLDRRQITAREIDERHEEKLIELGPVLERQHREKLGPLIRRVYDRVIEMGKVEPLPEEYDGVSVTVDYISMLAQAQRAIATGGIERFAAFTGNLAGVNPEVLDNFDMDAAVQEYGEMVGVPGRLIRPADDVAGLRETRNAQQQQAEGMAAAQSAAGAAKDGAAAAKLLAEADATGRPVDILRNLGLA